MNAPRFFVHWLRDWRIRRADRRFEKMKQVLLSLKQDEFTEQALEEIDKERGRCLEAYTKSS